LLHHQPEICERDFVASCRNEKYGHFGSQLPKHVLEPFGREVLEASGLAWREGRMAPLPFGGQSLESSDREVAALNRLTPLLYEQLRRLARRHMVGQRRGHTFSTTDLINEAYLKLAHLDEPEWRNRTQFLSVASRDAIGVG